jgi:hypothetical protein
MATATTIRLNKKQLIAAYFRQHLHQPINSFELHCKFGTATRARISEINSDPDSDIVIRNSTTVTKDGEVSLYTASPRYSLFGDLTPDRSYKE